MTVADEEATPAPSEWARANSTAPFLGAAATASLAAGYAHLLGYTLAVPDPAAVVSFCLVFGGLGAGVTLAARRTPAAVGVGALAFVVFPAMVSRTGVASWPEPVADAWVTGGVAFGVFLVAAGYESALRWPNRVRSRLLGRDTYAVVVVGVVLAAATVAARAGPETIDASAFQAGVHVLVVGARWALLVASVVLAGLFLTRLHTVTPTLIAAAAFGTAALGTAPAQAVWGASASHLADQGVVLLVFGAGAGLLEVATRDAVASLRRSETRLGR